MTLHFLFADIRSAGVAEPYVERVPQGALRRGYISARIAWRYKHGAPRFTTSSTYRGDSRLLLRQIVRPRRGYDLLFTSPPYFSIVNYHYDQWLRLWLLGGPTYPKKSSKNQSKGSFQHSIEYQNLLYDVFSKSAEIMRRGAAVYVRTDAREFSLAAAVDAMRLAFPGRAIRIRDQPYKGKTQTVLFGDKKDKPGEVDLIIPSRVIS